MYLTVPQSGLRHYMQRLTLVERPGVNVVRLIKRRVGNLSRHYLVIGEQAHAACTIRFEDSFNLDIILYVLA
jgi:hypothetical protein